MKVRIATTVDIDPEAWALEYGCEIADVRWDAQNHLENTVHQHVADLGVGV